MRWRRCLPWVLVVLGCSTDPVSRPGPTPPGDLRNAQTDGGSGDTGTGDNGPSQDDGGPTGDFATGDALAGDPNTGDGSLGDRNQGDSNQGDSNPFVPGDGMGLVMRFPNPCTFPPAQSTRPYRPSAPIITGLTEPAFITHAPSDPGGDRLFVAQRGGQIISFPKSSPMTQTTYLQMIPGHSNTGDLGLVSIAFHPDFATNGHLYVYMARTSPRRSVISRFTASPPDAATVDPSTELLLFEVRQPAGNHNGGTVAFGPDGFLYVAFGDGGPQQDPDEHTQNPTNLHGSVVRIDVDGGTPYAIPPGNIYPTAGGAVPCGTTMGTGGVMCSVATDYTCSDTCAEIWALGFRSPWKWSFDRLTGDLWLGDVGQSSWEEINLVRAGLNYGWDCREGFNAYNDPDPPNPMNGAPCTGPFEDPVIAYPNPAMGRSVVGGYVYHGSDLPELQGTYIYGDTFQDEIWGLRYDGSTISFNEVIADSTASTLVSFGEDSAGEIYMVYYGGSISRLERTPPTTPMMFPTDLAATGCFADVPTRTPNDGLIPYDLNAPLWSDGTMKRRYLVMPDASSTIDLPLSASPSDVASNTSWEVPADTLFIKEFSRTFGTTEVPLETRFLILRGGGVVEGYSYKWRDDRMEADLLPGGDTQCYDVNGNYAAMACDYTHTFPSRSDCRFCHNAAAGGNLGPKTSQINRTFDYGGFVNNQLAEMARIGLFSTALPDTPPNLLALPTYAGAGTAEARARSYLDSNCALCHRPGGPMPSIDLRYETQLTSTAACGTLPNRGDLGVMGALIIDPGSSATSVLHLRMDRRGPDQMPPLATGLIDSQGVALVGTWIDNLPMCP